jgi:hypothetical protein
VRGFESCLLNKLSSWLQRGGGECKKCTSVFSDGVCQGGPGRRGGCLGSCWGVMGGFNLERKEGMILGGLSKLGMHVQRAWERGVGGAFRGSLPKSVSMLVVCEGEGGLVEKWIHECLQFGGARIPSTLLLGLDSFLHQQQVFHPKSNPCTP